MDPVAVKAPVAESYNSPEEKTETAPSVTV
jgi:hypothetical protein